ncbi:DUF1396 domain-containing protein [Streptomyces sp. NBC_01304]|uniref:DUF1396 domain-containing protein n=1 Tax=Streptomyces sp. NBC_01304 TaxID=2903818 RepID=UPI002E0E04F4|nr:DUF1396 domain-containing protein [Streptomyces sp. NBC_01304]
MKFAVRSKAATAAAVLAATLLAGGAVGCSSAKDDKSGKSTGQDKSEQSPKMEPAAAVKQAVVKAEKFTSFSYRLKGEAPGKDGGKVSGEASMNLKPLTVSMKMTGGGETFQIRIIGDAMYMGTGKPDPDLDGKSWMKFPMDGMDKGGSPAEGSPADKNPASEAGLMEGAEDVKLVGEEKVDGVQTTHYAGTVTLDEMRKSLKDKSADVRKSREKNLKEYEELGLDKLTMDLWIDGDGHAKQVRTRGTTDEGPLDMKMTFFDINKPVKVTAPPAAQVADLSEMLKGEG